MWSGDGIASQRVAFYYYLIFLYKPFLLERILLLFLFCLFFEVQHAGEYRRQAAKGESRCLP